MASESFIDEGAAAPVAAHDRDAPPGYGNESKEAADKRSAAERALWWWNAGCGVLHLVQAAIVLGIGECALRAPRLGGRQQPTSMSCRVRPL